MDAAAAEAVANSALITASFSVVLFVSIIDDINSIFVSCYHNCFPNVVFVMPPLPAHS